VASDQPFQRESAEVSPQRHEGKQAKETYPRRFAAVRLFKPPRHQGTKAFPKTPGTKWSRKCTAGMRPLFQQTVEIWTGGMPAAHSITLVTWWFKIRGANLDRKRSLKVNLSVFIYGP
jgi:hypothetical protein